MKSKEIRDLIDFISNTGLNEVNIETEELKLSVVREAKVKTQSAPVQMQAPIAQAAPVAASNPENLHDSGFSNAADVPSSDVPSPSEDHQARAPPAVGPYP